MVLVSRPDFLERVITAIELLECNQEQTNILCIVDGTPELFIKTRNLINDLKFNQRLCIESNYPDIPKQLDIPTRRKRIAAAHNQAKDLIQHNSGHVFTIEDDTIIPKGALKTLQKVATRHRAFGMAEGVELARWGIPYVGAWKINDIYNPTQLESIDNIQDVTTETKETNIDAGGLYCSLIRADLYKQHEFTSDNGLGPDVNFGIELRQLGYENFIVWQVQCTHLNIVMGKEVTINATDDTQKVIVTKVRNNKWHASY